MISLVIYKSVDDCSWRVDRSQHERMGFHGVVKSARNRVWVRIIARTTPINCRDLDMAMLNASYLSEFTRHGCRSRESVDRDPKNTRDDTCPTAFFPLTGLITTGHSCDRQLSVSWRDAFHDSSLTFIRGVALPSVGRIHRVVVSILRCRSATGFIDPVIPRNDFGFRNFCIYYEADKPGTCRVANASIS